MTLEERNAWEVKNEKNKAGVRWLIVLIVGPYLSYLLWSGKVSEIGQEILLTWQYICGVTSFIVSINLWVLWEISRWKKGFWKNSTKYITMAADFLAVALVLIPTGGNESMFFILNFVIIVSNSLRYGMRLALAGSIMMNFCYIAVIAWQYYPGVKLPGIQKEILKLGGFWLVGIYTGYLSRRFEILRGEVEKYQQLLAEALKTK